MVAALPETITLTTHVLPNGLDITVAHLETVSESLAQGNKIFKLNHWLQELKSGAITKDRPWVSFGGAWSNHLLALAQIGQELGLFTIGLVRGPKPLILNQTLKACQNAGMELRFIERNEYRQMASDSKIPQDLISQNPVIIPEGGRGFEGLLGAAKIADYLPKDIRTIILSAGTGTTAGGLLKAYKGSKVQIWALAPFAKPNFLKDDLAALGLGDDTLKQFNVFSTDKPFGGFGKVTQNLLKYISESKQAYQMELDPVYTSKAWHWLENLTESEFPSLPAVFIHTGGLRPDGHY